MAAHETLVVELVQWQDVARDLTAHVCKRLTDPAASKSLEDACTQALTTGALRDLVLALLRQMDAVLATMEAPEGGGSGASKWLPKSLQERPWLQSSVFPPPEALGPRFWSLGVDF